MRLWFDFETWSDVPIRRGTDAYMDGARPLLLSYSIDDAPVEVLDFTEAEAVPEALARYLSDSDVELWAHNVFFDRMVLSRCLHIDIPIARFRCSYALALLHGLPGGLGPLGLVLGIPAASAKLEDGKRLIRKFCGPKPLKKDSDWALFKEYAANDISAMRACVKAMPLWNAEKERATWETDQIINNRGFQVDDILAASAVKALQANKAKLAEECFSATGGTVAAATQRDKLLDYICEAHGYYLQDLTAASIAAALQNEDLDPAVRNILEIRLQSAKSSTSKFQRLLDSAGKDNRLRGTLQYSGAGRTARWAGRIFQPQNLPRPTMPQSDINLSIELIRGGRADLLPLVAPINEACANALRGLIVAAHGNRLMVADWSAIEGRANAWLAGESWKVNSFREGKDLYKEIYGRAFNISPENVTKSERQIGKVCELALGYGGGVGAFVSMAAGSGMDLEEMAKAVVPNPKAKTTWEWALKTGKTYGLSEEAYVACDTLKIGYRKANPNIQRFWAMLEAGARNAIDLGQRSQVGQIIIDGNKNWMRIMLPSGRFLCYALPKIGKDGAISYMAWQNNQWCRVKTYGGKICENIVQATCRDLLAHTLMQMEAHGYPVVLHIHDEVIAEVPEIGQHTLNEFIKLMCLKPSWAKGLPLNAEGFEGVRYEK